MNNRNKSVPDYRTKLIVVHNAMVQPARKSKRKRKPHSNESFKNWIMPVEQQGYIKSKRHDCL
jgi:hypothetical protein